MLYSLPKLSRLGCLRLRLLQWTSSTIASGKEYRQNYTNSIPINVSELFQYSKQKE
ncbi:hypothetical protein QNH05_gp30 [Escherichia phage vB_EcoM_DE15]|uniref:Uncharacterized protein n=1 Tax=Escherichia phage vB_EcoM_DE15 TaxID=3003366 RepID=A0AAE9VIX2_9CAUD|nr:hypothetical protein QNH05_gp30 [Escherichia phage vB_EcoM_DE15]WAX24545.1 hypothetical protein [Escherichia phage vB_EcoM_DE15]